VLLDEYKEFLLERKINPASSIDYDINGELHTLTLEWIISAFLQAQKEELFSTLFKKVMQGTNADIEQFFQQMGQLVLMSSLSEKEFKA